MFAWLRNRLPQPLWWLLLAATAFNCLLFVQGLCEGTFHFESVVGWGSVAMQRFEPTYPQSRANHLLADLAELTTPPLGVPKIMYYFDWWERLGLIRMDPFEDGVSYRNLYNPKALFHEVRRPNTRGKWHHWIFLSGNFNVPDGGLRQRNSDDAFEELMIYHGNHPHQSLHPAANNARFHYLSCSENMLCRVLVAQGPALIHLTTETLDGGLDGITEGRLGFDRVAMRVIELPLKPETLCLPPGVFPSPFNQLRSLTDDPDAWRAWKAETPVDRIHARLRKHSFVKAIEHKWTYGLIVRMEMLLPKSFSVNPLATPVYMAGWTTAAIANFMWRFGPIHFIGVVRDIFPKLAAPQSRETRKALEKEKAKVLEDIVIPLYSCTDDYIGKMKRIPEVRSIINSLWSLLPRKTRAALEHNDPALMRQCKDGKTQGSGLVVDV